MVEYLEQNIEDVKNYVQKNYTFRQISRTFSNLNFPAHTPNQYFHSPNDANIIVNIMKLMTFLLSILRT
jgi:hypothetical protein